MSSPSSCRDRAGAAGEWELPLLHQTPPEELHKTQVQLLPAPPNSQPSPLPKLLGDKPLSGPQIPLQGQSHIQELPSPHGPCAGHQQVHRITKVGKDLQDHQVQQILHGPPKAAPCRATRPEGRPLQELGLHLQSTVLQLSGTQESHITKNLKQILAP